MHTNIPDTLHHWLLQMLCAACLQKNSSNVATITLLVTTPYKPTSRHHVQLLQVEEHCERVLHVPAVLTHPMQ